VHTLFLPATSRQDLQDLSRLRWEQLAEEFRQEVNNLKTHVLRSLKARRFSGKQVTGAALAKELRLVVEGLQKGMLQELPSLWKSWAKQVEEVSLNDADTLFASMAQTFDDKSGERPVTVALFNKRLDEARERAITFYRALIRDFNIPQRVDQLRKRLDWQVNIVKASYHDRIRRWVAELAASTKEGFGKDLGTRGLPADPRYVEKEGETKRNVLAQNFSATLANFGAAAASSWLGAPKLTVTMPPFSQDPATQLAADLRAQLAAHVLDNERALQQLFKRAVSVADATVERMFNASSGRLLSSKQLAAVRSSAEERCWQAFDQELSAYKWIPSNALYKQHRLLLQEEYLKARSARLIATNEQLLTVSFRSQVDRLLAQYAASVSRMAMPVPEDVINGEHSRIASVAQTSLDSVLGNYSDTVAFENAKNRLKTALEEGLSHTREKNYEFWKVHSDLATRCAVNLNKAAERDCGLLCLFLTVPWAHKSSARSHLNQCFKQSSTGSTLSSSLQHQVFEIWYKKDLGHEAERVSTRFYALMWTLLLIIGGMSITCCLGRTDPYYQGQMRWRQPWRQSWWFPWRHPWSQWQPAAAPYSGGCPGGYVDYGYAARPANGFADARAKAAHYGAGYRGACYEDYTPMRGGFRPAGG